MTGLLASIIRPIIQEEMAKLIAQINELYKENKAYAEFDKEVEIYAPKLAEAGTSAERWALLQDLKDKRAKLLSR